MTDVVEFLRARLDEDEAVAREAIEQRRQARMDHHQPDYDMQAWPDVSVPSVLVGPERVLREVEAKRDAARAAVRVLFPSQDRRGDFWDGQRAYAEASLRTLASIYADHPDHDPEWR